MAIADYLEKIGEGAKKVGKVAGAVAEPLGKSVAETLSGEAPQIHAEKRQHAQQLSDEQRQNEINDLEKQLDEGRKYGTLTTEQQKQYTDAIARHYSDPSQMGTLIQKLHKATHPGGATYQPYAPQLADPTPQGGTTRADETEKLKYQADEAKQQQEQNQENTKASWDFFSKFIPDEDKPKAQSEWAMKNLGVAQTLKNIPGAAGEPVKGADGRYYLPKEQADGTIVQEPMPPNWTPAPKQAQPKVGTVNGKPAWGTLTPSGWVNPETQEPIPNFIPPPNYAQVAIPLADARARASAQYGVQEVTDNNGKLIDTTRLDVINRARSGNPYGGKEISAPTGQEKTRQDFANSGKMQVQTMRDIINRNMSMFGPGPGRAQDLAAWIGSSSPDAQRFRTAALILADHSAGVFGGRSVQTVDELKNTITSMHLTPDALLAGLDQDEKTFDSMSNANGRLPSAGAKSVNPGQILPKTGAQPISDDDFLLQFKKAK